MHRSPRLRGQLLVVAGALLGALIGVALGLTGEGGGAGAAALVTTPPSSRPPASRATPAEPPTGRDSSSHQRAQSAGRPGKGPGKSDKREPDRDSSGGHGKAKPDKGKEKDKASKERLEKLVTQEYPLERAPEALRWAMEHPAEAMKVVIGEIN